MKIVLSTVKSLFVKEDLDTYEKIGFEFKPFVGEEGDTHLFVAKDYLYMEITTLDELVALAKVVDGGLIIRENDGELDVTIYDGYNE